MQRPRSREARSPVRGKVAVTSQKRRPGSTTSRIRPAAFELRGDYLGESLSSFKERHPKVYCYDVNDVTVACFDNTGSFAGHNPYDCDKDCFNSGLGADFFKGRLTFVHYSVALNGESDVLKLLTDKYGKPNEHYESEYLATASW